MLNWIILGFGMLVSGFAFHYFILRPLFKIRQEADEEVEREERLEALKKWAKKEMKINI